MVRSVLFLILVCINTCSYALGSLGANQTFTHEDCIKFYEQLALKHPEAKLTIGGTSDIGRPIHTFVISNTQCFDPSGIKSNQLVWLINNGIHPGESCGIDATALWAEKLLNNKKLLEKLNDVIIVIVPIYNVDGALNRNNTSRVNQNGPEAYGFRANARNLDLNRDFVKSDSKNAFTFAHIFHQWKPHVFIDTHISNGADYQYTMTLIATHHAPLNSSLHESWKVLNTEIFKAMEKNNFEMVPYVDLVGQTPEEGILGFVDEPRYSTGYAALFNCIGFMTETHMLKPYANQVKATEVFLQQFFKIVVDNKSLLVTNRNKADVEVSKQQRFILNWELDTTRADTIAFKGYTAIWKPSEISKLPRLYYDRSKPTNVKVPFYNYFLPTDSIEKPTAYIVPQAWHQVIDRLKANNINLTYLTNDTIINVEAYFAIEYTTAQKAVEGHYPFSNLKLAMRKQPIKFFKGDAFVRCGTPSDKFLVNVLEPSAPDSYFKWNFFDAVLQQKEYFSDYVFEELAIEILAKDPKLQLELNSFIEKNNLQRDHQSYLDFIYSHSIYAEPGYNRIPVYRVVND